jgi:hypothetical protein
MLYGSQYPGGKIFNSAAFVAAPSGEQGDLRRAMRYAPSERPK